MEKTSPPIVATASGFCISLPAPNPSANGTTPNIEVNVVMMIGRMRMRPAKSIVSSMLLPSRRNLSTSSNSRMPFLTTPPTSKIKPMNEETLRGMRVSLSAITTPKSESGTLEMMTSGIR